jgi:small subunit ribosomal protein S18
MNQGDKKNGGKGRKRKSFKPDFRRMYKKDCVFCKEKRTPDYKDYESVRMYVSERARIMGRVYTGLCNKHQRRLATAIKRDRFLGLLPFVPK